MTNKELEKSHKEFEVNLIEMAKAIKELAQDVAELKTKPVQKSVSQPASTSTTITAGVTTGSVNVQSTFPVPPEYRELVNNVLNKLFGIEIEWTPAGFLFTVIVPDKYNTLDAKQKEMLKVDKRTKLIPNYEGANGVRQWVELIYSSFSQEIKGLITADRT